MRISGKVARMDPIELAHLERVAKHSPPGFSGIPASPIGLSNPVTELSTFMLERELQSNRANQGARLVHSDRKRYGFIPLERRPMRTDPLLRHPVLIRMWDAQGGRRNGSLSGQPSHFGRVGEREPA